MQPPEFQPPYDSPIEEYFAYDYSKYASPDVDLCPQFEVNTICGNFRIDFMLKSPDGRLIGVECDGKDFHERGRDEWRDASILGDSEVHSIYRFRGTDLYHHSYDCLYIMMVIDPELFSERGRINIMALASDHVKSLHIDPIEEQIRIWEFETGQDPKLYLRASRFHKLATPWARTCWKELYAFARSVGGGPVESISQKYLARHTHAT